MEVKKSSRKLTRRQFLILAGQGASALAILTACGEPIPIKTPTSERPTPIETPTPQPPTPTETLKTPTPQPIPLETPTPHDTPIQTEHITPQEIRILKYLRPENIEPLPPSLAHMYRTVIMSSDGTADYWGKSFFYIGSDGKLKLTTAEHILIGDYAKLYLPDTGIAHVIPKDIFTFQGELATIPAHLIPRFTSHWKEHDWKFLTPKTPEPAQLIIDDGKLTIPQNGEYYATVLHTAGYVQLFGAPPEGSRQALILATPQAAACQLDSGTPIIAIEESRATGIVGIQVKILIDPTRFNKSLQGNPLLDYFQLNNTQHPIYPELTCSNAIMTTLLMNQP